MGGEMNNPLQHLIDRAYALCLKLNLAEIINDLLLMSEAELLGLIFGLQRIVDLGGAL